VNLDSSLSERPKRGTNEAATCRHTANSERGATEESGKVSDRCFEQRRWRVQKARWRGKSPYSVVNVRAMGNAEIS
jgi:hypothetical protein